MIESTKVGDRTWFDVWQARRIASRQNRRQFQIMKAVGDLATVVERTKFGERDMRRERTMALDRATP